MGIRHTEKIHVKMGIITPDLKKAFQRVKEKQGPHSEFSFIAPFFTPGLKKSLKKIHKA